MISCILGGSRRLPGQPIGPGNKITEMTNDVGGSALLQLDSQSLWARGSSGVRLPIANPCPVSGAGADEKI